MNGEYVCELARAHYQGDSDRFDVLLRQLIESPSTPPEVVRRLTQIQIAAYLHQRREVKQ